MSGATHEVALPTTGFMVPLGHVLTPRGNDLFPVLGPVVTARHYSCAVGTVRQHLQSAMNGLTAAALVHMTEAERDCVRRFVKRLREALGEDLHEIWLFGSFARGDMWGPASPMNSDIDLLILTRASVSAKERDALLNGTYPLYLECGRQISPQFKTRSEYQNPTNERGHQFRARVESEGRLVFAASG